MGITNKIKILFFIFPLFIYTQENSDDKSNLNYLCAAGVCFMTLISINSNLRKTKWFIKNKIQEPNLLDFLDLVSLGTICDVVPLIGLNRAIVKQGLKIVNLRKNLGLKYSTRFL